MRERKKNEAGITLIALVISIIVMLILAGVSLNAMVGENGILTQAQNAKLAQELAQEQEELEYMLANYNIDAEHIGTIDEYLQGKVNSGELDKFAMIPDPSDTAKRVRMIQKGSNFYYVLEDGDYYQLQKMNTDVSGEIGEGYTIVTANNFSGGTMDFNPGAGNSATLIFNDRITADYNFNITSGEVTIYIDNDMTLTNADVKDELTGEGRSAINIYPNAILNLHIASGKTLKVDSGFGEDGEVGNKNGAKGGPGGYAGVHVPTGATLRLYGEGTIKAYGGNAGNGVNSSETYGGAGGGGAGAGIGGNGGKGGDANSTEIEWNFSSLLRENIDPSDPQYNTNSSWDGLNGEDCGIVEIHDSVKVYAYGGSGGGAGNGVASSGGGGGGYPAAGIGGGGAGGGGGNHYDGGGGFSGAGSQHNNTPGLNGLGGGSGKGTNKNSCCGGGYYSSGVGKTPFWQMGLVGGMGGGHCYGGWGLDYVGSGGKAGSGGQITYADVSNIFAYNGDMITNGDYTSGHYQYTKDGLYLYKLVSGNKVYQDYIWDNSEEKYYYFNDEQEKVYEEGTVRGDVFEVATKRDVNDNVVSYIPTFIFAQSGTIRKTYTTNMSSFTYAKIARTLNDGETLPSLATNYDTVVTVLATNETNTGTTGYSNGYIANQGIGSGAGYLESENGSFFPLNH